MSFHPLAMFFSSRLWALMYKETVQTIRNPQFIVFLLISPVFQIITYGVALNPDVHDIRLGIVDAARSRESGELISAFVENKVFVVDRRTVTLADLGRRLREGNIDAGLVIPPDFERARARDAKREVQVLLDGVNAYTAGLASSYASEIVEAFGRRNYPGVVSGVTPRISFLYNPGLVSSWYFVAGIIGMLMTTLSIVTTAIASIREKENGTLEQLMMTPASALQILVAKIVPTFLLIMGVLFFALLVAHATFGMPLRGNLAALSLASGLYIVVGMGIGILFATVMTTTPQTILSSIFVMLPMIQLSGTIAPLESMPPFFLDLSLVNPLRHYTSVLREVLLKGAGFDVVWPQILVLTVWAVVLLVVSSNRFRNQLR